VARNPVTNRHNDFDSQAKRSGQPVLALDRSQNRDSGNKSRPLFDNAI
jgi:hypothetical protein